MINARFREQYTDAVSCFLRDQELAGLDIVTDGDARFDTEVAGYSWFSYALTRVGGVSFEGAYGRPVVFGRLPYPRGHILQRRDGGAGQSHHHRPGVARHLAIHAALADGAAHDPEAGEVRHHHRRADRAHLARQAL